MASGLQVHGVDISQRFVDLASADALPGDSYGPSATGAHARTDQPSAHARTGTADTAAFGARAGEHAAARDEHGNAKITPSHIRTELFDQQRWPACLHQQFLVCQQEW